VRSKYVKVSTSKFEVDPKKLLSKHGIPTYRNIVWVGDDGKLQYKYECTFLNLWIVI
jgi:hypothetical protein